MTTLTATDPADDEEAASSAPDEISGLVRAWRPDAGVTVGADGITSVAGAWGTTVALTQSGAACPDVGTDLAPDGTDLFDFTAADSEQFSFTATGGLTAFTVVFVVAQKTQSTPQGILGAASPATMYIQLGAAATKVQLRAGSGDVNHDLTLPRGLVKNLEIIAVTYDGTTATPYLDGVAGTGTTISGQTFNFDKVGALDITSNDLDAYMGPLLIYDRALSATQVGQLYNYLAPNWRGSVVYVAAAGSDSSVTPWLQATPLALPSTAVAYASPAVEVALKGGDVFRQTAAKILTDSAGTSATRRNKISGSRWGTGKAQIRFSVAPTITNTSGTIYSLAGTYTADTIPAGLNPGTDFGYVYYVPGGQPTFTRDGYDVSTNVMRLTYETTTTTPTSGKWSFSGSTIYVNAGQQISNGDIEVPVDSIGPPSLVNPFHILHDNWTVEDIVVAFAEDKGFNNLGSANVEFIGCEAWFVGSDGFDGFDDGADVCSNFELTECIAAWCGRGPTVSGSFGDGFSLHDTAQADFYDCESWYCDKSGAVHQAPSVSRLYRCLHIGSQAFRHAENSGQIGSMLMDSCIAIVPDGALQPNAVQNTCLVNSPLTVSECALVSLSDGDAGSGIFQTTTSGAITATDNTIYGFAIGRESRGGITASENTYAGNGTNYDGVAPGAGDTASGLFALASDRWPE